MPLHLSSYLFKVVIALAIIAGSPPNDLKGITLTQDGTPKATIVIAKAALGAPTEPPTANLSADVSAVTTNKVAAAAHDLQIYVEKISGAKLPIVSDEAVAQASLPVDGQNDRHGGLSHQVLILVGRSALTKEFDSKIPSGLTPSRREESFLVLCKDERLLLAGNDEGPYHGTEYAVAEFLERLGVRWFMPGEYGEVIPKQPTIQVDDLEVRQKPDFLLRKWGSGCQTPESRAIEYRWKVRNRMNPGYDLLESPCDGTLVNLMPEAKFKEDPALFGKKEDGSPYRTMANLTNPKSVEMVAASIKERFRKNPNDLSCGFAPDDGMPRDWTPETVKRSKGFPDVGGRAGVPSGLSVTEEWLDFVKQVAREVKKEFPDRLIGTNGYANRNTPPWGIELDPNIYIMFAAIWSDTMHAYDNPKSWQTIRQAQMIQRWCEVCRNVYMYDYTYGMLASASTPLPLSRKVARDFPLFKKWGVIGFADEGRCVLMESGIFPRWLRARMMWNADLDVKAASEDFYAKWYGAAAQPARAFWDALETTFENTPVLGHEDRILPYVYTPELMAELKKHFAEAARRADTETVKKHVEADRLTLEHLKGYLAMTEAEWAGDFAEAVKQADYMLAQRAKLNALSMFYSEPNDADPTSGFYYWGVVNRKAYYQKLADRISGKTGDIIARLPDKAQFRTDPRDEGRFSDWHAPELKNGKDWQTVLTTKPFYLQVKGGLDEAGYPWLGNIWYRLKVDVPSFAKGKKVMLYAPTVETEAWVWVNGKFAGYRSYVDAYIRPESELDVDVTDALQPGKSNTIAVRVNTGLNAAEAPGGFYSRLLLYSPK
ncbi:MAG: DUF4838 domain-containing protein [Verrucomicrobia bacterium]|nr:DUF4838 domain-containing protein [Verrucomicrobiota bacterium]